MVLLELRNLNIKLKTHDSSLSIIEHINIKLREGEICGLVGESGSGKTLIAKAIMGINNDNWQVTTDRFLFNGQNISKLSSKKRRKLIGKHISMIFQEPEHCLDPLQRIGKQLIRAIPSWTFKGKWWQRWYWKKNRAIKLLHRVGIREHKLIMSYYPHQLTTGECQKVMIAIALANQPKLLIADEPTNAMEATTQAQIFRLLASMNQNLGTTILLISHDLQTVTKWTDRIHVLYCGQTVEMASSEELIKTPFHPYTEALINTIPDFGQAMRHKSFLSTLSGNIPSLEHLPIGCRLGPRCPYAQKKCITTPPLINIRNHAIACHFPLNTEKSPK